MSDSYGSDLDAVADSILTRSDFAAFVRLLRDDLDRNPAEWENDTLSRFLDALAAWTDDMEGAFHNQGRAFPEAPTWGMFALMLRSAQIYE